MEGNKIRMGGKKELMQLRGIFVQIGPFQRLLKVEGQFYNIEGFLSLLFSFPTIFQLTYVYVCSHRHNTTPALSSHLLIIFSSFFFHTLNIMPHENAFSQDPEINDYRKKATLDQESNNTRAVWDNVLNYLEIINQKKNVNCVVQTRYRAT